MTTRYRPTPVEHQMSEQINAMDQIVDGARYENRDLTDTERADYLAAEERYNALKATVDGDLDIFARHDALTAGDGQPARRNVPNFNRGLTPPPHAERSLDELFWATPERVSAGSISDRGQWRPSVTGATAEVDQVALRSDAGHLTYAPRISTFSPEHQGAIVEFQRCVADMALAGLLLEKSGARTAAEGFEVSRSHPAFRDRWDHVLRAMDVDTGGEGGTWVPTGIGADLHAKVRAAGKVAPLFTRIDMPTNPWKWPIEGGDANAYRVAEPTTDTADKVTASTPGTVATTFDAEILGARSLFSRSVDIDSALAIMPYVRAKIVRAFVDAEEKAILDGDADGTHQDTDVQAIGATDVRTAWDGLRKKGLAQTAINTAAATTVAKLAELRAAMGKWGLNPADLAFIVGVSAFYDVVTDDAVQTVDKFGPQATILNGQLGALYGIPIIVSEHVREDLNATGFDDGITATDTYNLLVNRNEWAIGQRQALDIELDDSLYRESYQRVLIGFQREDFAHIGDAATNDDTAIGYGVTP